MNNKTIVALLFLLLFSLGAQAQVSWSVSAGMTYSNTISKRDGNKASTESIPGISFGLDVDLPLSGAFSLQLGIQYAKRGFKEIGRASCRERGESGGGEGGGTEKSGQT